MQRLHIDGWLRGSLVGAIFGGALARPSETASSRKRGRYYALVCRCDTELVLGNHGPFDPAQCRTLARGVPPGVSQRAALLKGQLKHPRGTYHIGFEAYLVAPWFVRLTDPRALTPQELARVRRYKSGDDWLSLVGSLRD